ncbi:PEP-CTERM sorting domain-containing protein [Phragmitibacter flavus]|uniref:PEP-CTERM sorting domain-containing protein n=1 Tax=Phragmitibacter flavus TaxID=2576071 RepID=A0A5R8KJB9_9BACT|nr:autotransporter-associated beta strand repeat-containing protein [Phragmitibacter flavus]TLD72428.1 PEP-CTERM sorting domain-containing protein [Phragmitibacter flavus]
MKALRPFFPRIIKRALFAASLGAVPMVPAADFNWNVFYHEGTFDWQNHSHWNPDSLSPVNVGVLPNAVGDVANFNVYPFQRMLVNLNGGVTLGALNLDSWAFRNGGLTLAAGIGGSLTMNNGGLGAVIQKAGNAGDLISTNMVLAEALTVEVDGAPLTMSGVMTGAGNLIKTGEGLLILRGDSVNWAGNVLINEGNLMMAPLGNDGRVLGNATGTTTVAAGATLSYAPDALGAGGIGNPAEIISIQGDGFRGQGVLRKVFGASEAAITGAVTMTGESRIQNDISGTFTIASAFNVNHAMEVGGLGFVSFSGVVSGSEAITHYGTDGFRLSNAANTYSGAINSVLGEVRVEANATNAGAYKNVSAFNLTNSMLRIVFNNAANINVNAVADATAINLKSGRIRLENSGFSGNPAFNFEETLGVVSLSGGGSVIDMRGVAAANSQTLTVTDLLRSSPGSTLFLNVEGAPSGAAQLGASTYARVMNANSAAIVPDDGIVNGWMVTRLHNGVGGFVKYGANGYTALVDADYALNTPETGWLASQNVKTDNNRTLTAARTVNSLSITSDTNRTIDGLHALTVDSGGIMFSRGSTGGPTHTIRTSTLTSGTNELFLHTANANAFIFSNIIDGAGGALSVVKAGSNTVQFFAANGYTGTTYINEGTIRDVVGSNIVGLGSGNLDINGSSFGQSVYESDRHFTRGLGSGVGEVQLSGGQGSGFSAYGRAIDLNFGGAGAPVTWGSTFFNPGMFTLNGGNATHATTLVNDLDLAGETRYLRVDGNSSGGFRGAIARIEGELSNGGVVKRGGGVLIFDREHSYENGTAVSEGLLWIREGGSAGANVLGNDILVGNLGALYVDSPNLIGDNQRIVLSNLSNDHAAAIGLGAGYGDGSGVNFQSFSANGGVMASGGNNIFISDDRVNENRPIAIQLNGIKETSVDLVGRAQAVTPNSAIWFGASTANAVYTGDTLTASRIRLNSVNQNTYLLGAGYGTLTIANENVLTGNNNLLVGSYDHNFRWNIGGAVYIPEAQNFTATTGLFGGVLVGNSGLLIVGQNGSLGAASNVVNLRGGEFRPSMESGVYSGMDSQYSGRNLDVRGGNSVFRVQTLGGAGFSKLMWNDITLGDNERVLTVSGQNGSDLQINNLVITPSNNGRNYLDVESLMTINGTVSSPTAGTTILRKRSGGTLILNGDNTHTRTELTRGNLVLTHLGANGQAGQQLIMQSDGDQTANLQLRPDASQIVGGNATYDMSEIRFQGGNNASTRIVTVGAVASGSENVNVHVAALSTETVSGLTNFDLIFDGFHGYRLTVDGGFTMGRDANFRTRGALLTIQGAINDGASTFNLLKAEQGTLWLNGNNTYSGTTTLNNGYLVAGHDNAFGDGSSAISMAGGSFSQLLLSGTRNLSRSITNNGTGSTQTIGGLDAGSKTFSGTITATRGINITAETGGDVTFTGLITGAGGITKVGNGTVIIDRATGNTYAGANIIADGVLIGKAQAGAVSPFGTNAAFTVTNGTLQIDGLAGNTNTATTAALTVGGGGGRVVVNDAADSFTTQFTFGSLVAPTGTAAGGTLVFNSTVGNLGGESQIRFTTAPAAVNGIIGAWAVAKNNIQDATYAAMNGTSVEAHNFGTNTGNIDAVTGANQVYDASGVGGTLTANRSVYAVRTDTSLDLGGFRLSVGDATATGRGGLLLNDGADISNGDLHFANNQLSVYVDDGGVSTISAALSNLRSNANNTLSASNVASAAVFTKFGLGTLELSGANSFQGNIQVNEGILSLTAANVIPTFRNLNAMSGSIVTIQPNGRINLNGNNQEFGNLAGANPGSVFHTGGILDLGTATLTVGREGSNQTFAGQIIGGAGSKISKIGGGTLSLTNINGNQANSLETLEINQGVVLTRADDNSWATPSGLAFSLPSTTNVILRGGQWSLRSAGDSTTNAQRIAVGNNLTVTGGDSTLSVDRPEGGGGNKLLTMGNLTLDVQRFLVTAANTYIPRFDGTTTLLNHARIQNDSQLVLAGAIVGDYTLTKIGGSDLMLSADNSAWSGGTVVSSGTLLFGNRGTDDIRYAGTNFVPSSTSNAGTGDIILNQGNFQNGTTAVRFNATSNVLTQQGQRVQVFGSQTGGTVRVDIGQNAALAEYGLRSTTNGSISLGIGDGGLFTNTIDQSKMGNGRWGISAFQGSTYYTADTLGAGVDNVYRFTGTSGGVLGLAKSNLLTGSASVEVGRGMIDLGSLPHATTAQIRIYGGADYTGTTTIHRGGEFNAINGILIFHGDLKTSEIDVYGRLEARGDGRFTNDDGSATATVVNLRPGSALQLNYGMDINDQFVISRQDNSNLGLETTENKWGDDTDMILDGAQLALVSQSGRVNQETVGEITIKGGAGILLSRTDTNGQIVLNTNYGINRIGQSALSIRENGNELGLVNLQSMKMFINDATWITNNTTNGILPAWMINASRNTFLSYNTNTGITNAAFTNTSGAVGTGATFFSSLTSSSIADYAGVTGDATLTDTSNVYALRVNHEGSGNDTTFTGGQINIHGGGLIHVGRDNARVNFNTTNVFFGDGTTAREAFVYTNQHQLRFGGNVTADNMTIFGTGAVRFASQNNAITGNVQLNGGTLFVEKSNVAHDVLGTATITLHGDHQNNSNGGTEIRGQMPILALVTDSTSQAYNNKVIVAGNVPLARIDTNRFTGSGSGTISIAELEIKGTDSLAGTLLQVVNNNGYNFAVTGNTTIGGTGPVGISVNTGTATLTGAVNSAANITKSGNGTLRFDASNTGLTGGFTLNRGEWRLNGAGPNIGGTGDVTLNFGTLRLANNGGGSHFNSANQDLFVNGQVSIITDRNGGSTGAHVTIGANNGTNTIVTKNNASLRFNAVSFGDDFYIESKMIVNDTLTLLTESSDVFLRDTIEGQGKVVKNGNWFLHFDNNVSNSNWTGGLDILHGFVRVTPAATLATLGTGQVTVGPTGAISLGSTTNIAGGAITRFQSGKTTSSVLAVNTAAALAAIDTLLPMANNKTRAGLGGILALDSLTVSTALNMANIQDGSWSLGALQDRNSTYSATSLGVGAGNIYRIGGGGGNLTLQPGAESDVLSGAGAQVMIGRPNSYFSAGYNSTHVVFGSNLNNSYSGGTTVSRARDFGGGWYQTGFEVQGGNPTASTFRTPLGTGPVDNYGSIRFSGAAGGLVNEAGENYTTIVMHTGSRLTFDNRTASNDPGGEGRFDDSGVLTLNGSNLQIRGTSNVNTATTNREDIGELVIQRGSQVRIGREGTGFAGLGMNALTRGLHGTLSINHTSGLLGANTADGGVNNTEVFFITGGGAIPMTNNMVAPWIVSRQADQFLKYDATNGLQLITQGGAPANYINPAAATTSLSGALGAAVTDGTGILDLAAATGTQTLASNLDVHALRYLRDINTSADGQFNQIKIRSGGLILGGNNAGTINADLYFGSSGNGDGEALIYAGANVAQINGKIYADQVTKFGRNALYIRGDQSQFTGNWVVNEGVLRFLTPGSNGSSTSQVILNGSATGDNDDRRDGGDSHTLTDLQYVFNSGSVDLFDWGGGKITAYDHNRIFSSMGGVADRNQKIADIDLRTTATTAGGLQEGLMRFQVDGARNTLFTGTVTLFDNYMVLVDAGSYGAGSTTGVSFGALDNNGVFDLIKTGDGILTLGDNSSTFDGNRFSFVDEGTVRVLHNGAFGAAGNTAVINQGGAIEIAVANYQSTATLDQRFGSIERWSVDGARSGTVNLGEGVHLQIGASQTGTQTINLNGGSIMGYQPLDYDQIAIIQTLGSGVTINLLANSFLGQPYVVGGNAVSYDMGKLNTTTNLNPNDPGLRGSYLQIDGNITGDFDLTKTGQDIILLNGQNSYRNTIIEAGILQIGRVNGLSTTGTLTTRSSGMFDLNGFDQEVSALAGTGGSVNNGAFDFNTFTVNQAAETTYAGSVDGNVVLVKQGEGRLELTGINGYRGGTRLEGGTLAVSSDANLGQVPLSANGDEWIEFNGGALETTATFTLAANRQIDLWENVDNIIRTAAATTLTIESTMFGSGGFAKEGDGTLVMAGLVDGFSAKYYSGDTVVRAGVLEGGANNTLSLYSRHVVDGGTLNVANFNQQVGSLQSALGAGTVALGDKTLQVGWDNTTDGSFAGQITGSGLLQKIGFGDQTVAGNNAGQTWSTLISNGRLSVASGASLGSGAVNMATTLDTFFSNETALQLQGVTTLANNINVGTENADGTAFLEKTGAGTASLTGTVTLGRKTFLAVGTGATLESSGAGTFTGPGSLVVMDGGTLSLVNANTYGSTAGTTNNAAIDGGTVVRSGTVLVGNSGSLGAGTVELGDATTVLATAVKGATTTSLLQTGTAIFEPAGDTGKGQFTGVSESIDGITYGVGDRILVKDEEFDPASNGIYTVASVAGGVMTLVRADDFNASAPNLSAYGNQPEMSYGVQVDVTGGTHGGKSFFMTAPNVAVLNGYNDPVRFREDVKAPNIALLQNTGGLVTANKIDVNATTTGGTTSVGGSTAFNSGNSEFTGGIALQDLDSTQVETKTVTLVSHTMGSGTGPGVKFSGIIGEAAPAQDRLKIVKAGSGVVLLSAVNDYHGGTDVLEGVLQVGEAGVGTTGPGGTVVFSGATLAGTGLINGVDVNTLHLISGMLKPGDSAGEGLGSLEVLGTLTMDTGSEIVFQLGNGQTGNFGSIGSLGDLDTTSVNYSAAVNLIATTWSSTAPALEGDYDYLNVTGTINLSDEGVITVTGNPASLSLGDVFNVMDASIAYNAGAFNTGGDIRGGGLLGDLALPTLTGFLMWDTSRFTTDGLLIVVTNVPEPGRAMLILLGVAALWMRRRRK